MHFRARFSEIYIQSRSYGVLQIRHRGHVSYDLRASLSSGAGDGLLEIVAAKLGATTLISLILITTL